jgi:hypothetical protein
MAESSSEQDDWNIPCSDDENYGVSVYFDAFCLGTLNWLVFVM